MANRSRAQDNTAFPDAPSERNPWSESQTDWKDAMKRVAPLILISIFLLLTGTAQAREGFFLRLGIGPGLAVESSQIKGTGLALVAKEHQIGYGITDRYALWIGEIGALIKQKVGTYDYVNVDGIVVGGTVTLPHDFLISISAGYARVAFAQKWTEPMGDNLDDGLALGLSAKHEWAMGSRFALSTGVVAGFYRTFKDNYTYFTFSAVLSLAFYLTPKNK
mgnify:CR=1 FL=1